MMATLSVFLFLALYIIQVLLFTGRVVRKAPPSPVAVGIIGTLLWILLGVAGGSGASIGVLGAIVGAGLGILIAQPPAK